MRRRLAVALIWLFMPLLIAWALIGLVGTALFWLPYRLIAGPNPTFSNCWFNALGGWLKASVRQWPQYSHVDLPPGGALVICWSVWVKWPFIHMFRIPRDLMANVVGIGYDPLIPKEPHVVPPMLFEGHEVKGVYRRH